MPNELTTKSNTQALEAEEGEAVVLEAEEPVAEVVAVAAEVVVVAAPKVVSKEAKPLSLSHIVTRAFSLLVARKMLWLHVI